MRVRENDRAEILRHRAIAAFQRRRRFVLLSSEWRLAVREARRFIRYCRDETRNLPHNAAGS